MAKSLISGQAMLKDKNSDRSFVYTPRELVEKCRPDNLYLISFDEYSAADPFDDTYRCYIKEIDELNDLNVAYRNDSKIKELVDMIKYCSVPVEVFKLIGDI